MKYTFVIKTNDFIEAFYLQSYIARMEAEVAARKLKNPDTYIIAKFKQREG